MADFEIDPLANLDYVFDWNDYLDTGEVISNAAIASDSGITDDGGTITGAGKTVTIWLSAGVVGGPYKVDCKITTNQGREDSRYMEVEVVDR